MDNKLLEKKKKKKTIILAVGCVTPFAAKWQIIELHIDSEIGAGGRNGRICAMSISVTSKVLTAMAGRLALLFICLANAPTCATERTYFDAYRHPAFLSYIFQQQIAKENARVLV